MRAGLIGQRLRDRDHLAELTTQSARSQGARRLAHVGTFREVPARPPGVPAPRGPSLDNDKVAHVLLSMSRSGGWKN